MSQALIIGAGNVAGSMGMDSHFHLIFFLFSLFDLI